MAALATIRSDVHEDERPRIEHPSSQSQASRVVLLVDDSRLLRESIAARMRFEGHAVFEACCFTEAVAFLETHSVDIVLSDHDLGDRFYTGFDVLSYARQRRPSARRFLMSGTIHPHGEDALYEAFIMKPFTFKELASRVFPPTVKATGLSR